MLTKVLSGASIILGLFIIISFFSGNQTPKDKTHSKKYEYHLGCYLTHQQISKKSQFMRRLQKLDETSRNINKKISMSPVNVNSLDRQSLDLARTFQSYIQEVEFEKEQRRSEVELVSAVKNAYSQFKVCSDELKETVDLNSENCVSKWQQYLKCSDLLYSLQNGLKSKLDEKSALSLKMKSLLDDIPNGKVSTASASESEKIDKWYKIQADKLEATKRKFEDELQTLISRMSVAQYSYQIAKNKTKYAEESYNQCHLHRRDYRACEQLGIQVRRLGHGSLQSLENKLNRKRKSLNEIKAILGKKHRGTQDYTSIQQYFNLELEEYRKLHKLFAETKASYLQSCGCSEEQQKSSSREYQARKAEEESMLKKIQDIEILRRALRDKISKVKEELNNLEKEYQRRLAEITSSDNQQAESAAKISKLAQLQEQDRAIEEQISSYRAQFDNLQKSCQQIKEQIARQVQDINKLSVCLTKKQYFQKLHHKYDQMKEKYPVSKEIKSQFYKQHLKSSLLDMKRLGAEAISDGEL